MVINLNKNALQLSWEKYNLKFTQFIEKCLYIIYKYKFLYTI